MKTIQKQLGLVVFLVAYTWFSACTNNVNNALDVNNLEGQQFRLLEKTGVGNVTFNFEGNLTALLAAGASFSQASPLVVIDQNAQPVGTFYQIEILRFQTEGVVILDRTTIVRNQFATIINDFESFQGTFVINNNEELVTNFDVNPFGGGNILKIIFDGNNMNLANDLLDNAYQVNR